MTVTDKAGAEKTCRGMNDELGPEDAETVNSQITKRDFLLSILKKSTPPQIYSIRQAWSSRVEILRACGQGSSSPAARGNEKGRTADWPVGNLQVHE